MSLRPLTTNVTFSVSVFGSGMQRHLLEVVDDDDELAAARELLVLLDEASGCCRPCWRSACRA